MLSPSSYRAFLKDADAVIHTTGILLEADYKGVISGRESPVAGLRRAFSGRKEGARGYGSANPLERRPPEEDEDKGEKKREEGRLESGERDGQLTYELMNRDSGELQTNPRPVEKKVPRLTEHSHRTCARIFQSLCPDLRLPLSRSRRTHASRPLHQYEARSGIDNRVVIPKDEINLYTARLSI